MTEEVLGEFHGSDEFPIEWQEGEKELFWIYDDLHIPNPVSPMFFDIGGWWLTCDHMFRRFGTPFACDWVAKQINGYVYTAAVPADSSIHSEATEYQARYVPRVPRDPEHAGKIDRLLIDVGAVDLRQASAYADSASDHGPSTGRACAGREKKRVSICSPRPCRYRRRHRPGMPRPATRSMARSRCCATSAPATSWAISPRQ